MLKFYSKYKSMLQKIPKTSPKNLSRSMFGQLQFSKTLDLTRKYSLSWKLRHSNCSYYAIWSFSGNHCFNVRQIMNVMFFYCSIETLYDTSANTVFPGVSFWSNSIASWYQECIGNVFIVKGFIIDCSWWPVESKSCAGSNILRYIEFIFIKNSGLVWDFHQ